MTKLKEVSVDTFSKVIELQAKAKLIIPSKVLAKIWYLCNKISSVEWSGIIFYKATGSIEKPSELVCTLEELYPMDKGSSGFTSYDFGTDVMKVYDNNPDLMECKYGHCHSHNSMGVFFSGTDISELKDNCENYQYYLSLIVNNKGEMCAKIAYAAEIEEPDTKLKYSKDSLSFETNLTSGSNSPQKAMIVINCDIEEDLSDAEFIAPVLSDYVINGGHITYDKNDKPSVKIDCEINLTVDRFFVDRVEEICKPKVTTYYGGGNYNVGRKWDYENKCWMDEEKVGEQNPRTAKHIGGSGKISINPTSISFELREQVKNHKRNLFDVYSFLTKIITMDPNARSDVRGALKEMNKWKNSELNSYIKFLSDEDNMEKWYFESTGESLGIFPINAKAMFVQAIDELSIHRKQYPHIVDEFTKLFAKYVNEILIEV